MKYLTALFVLFASLVGVFLFACKTNQDQRQLATGTSIPLQTKTFCENARHFESFYLCRTSYEIGADNQNPTPCPILWEMAPELSPDKLPLAKALAEAIEKDCKKPSGDCQIFNNTCSEEQIQIKQGILNCIFNKVQSFKASHCQG